MRLSRVPYYLACAARLAAGRPVPSVAGISLTDVCNLDCSHCWRKNGGRGHAPFDKVSATLLRLHRLGARYLYLQGGEPCAWEDGPRRLRDVVAAARAAGFFHVAVCTNGTYPLDAAPDSYSVSLDGSAAAHDGIRGPGAFERALQNIEAAGHRKVFLNATFNRRNAGELPELARLARSQPGIFGLMVNFHIPYPGVEGLALSQPERAALSREALRLKLEGFPILNTRSGLRALERNDWRRPIPVSVVSDCDEDFSCCRARGQEDICRQCGYAVWAELSRVLDFDLGAFWEALPRLEG